MAKQHYYIEEDPDEGPLQYEDRQADMLKRALISIGDLLDELPYGESRISIQQEFEMEEIIKDARVQQLL